MTEYERDTVVETRTTEPIPEAGTTRRVSERVVEPAGPGPLAVVSRVVVFAFGVLQVLLVLRIILLLLVANPGNEVVSFVLGVTDPFVEPFIGMFQLDRVTGSEGSILDIAAIVALIAWTLVEALILAALRIFDRRTVTA